MSCQTVLESACCRTHRAMSHHNVAVGNRRALACETMRLRVFLLAILFSQLCPSSPVRLHSWPVRLIDQSTTFLDDADIDRDSVGSADVAESIVYANYTGDIIIGAVFPIHERHPNQSCGRLQVTNRNQMSKWLSDLFSSWKVCNSWKHWSTAWNASTMIQM